MPIHDWTKVDAGIFHHFHVAWINEISNTLNDGRLPPGLYALSEQVTRPFGPDVVTLQAGSSNGNGVGNGSANGGRVLALLEAKPEVRFIQKSDDSELYARKANLVVIRHASDDRIVAMIELISPGNKSSHHAVDELLDKVYSALDQRIHLLLADLFPPTARDPQGLHALIWGDAAPAPPADQPLTLAAYNAVPPVEAYVEPTAVGTALIDMPLFLDAQHYILVPLEQTYQSAWRGVPGRWKAVLEAAKK